MNATHILELAAFSAWPALEQQDFEGWHLRFARGYTKRANSANCTPEAAELSEDRLAHIERLYRARGQTPVFRLTSCSAPPQTDSFLASKGYRRKHGVPARLCLLVPRRYLTQLLSLSTSPP